MELDTSWARAMAPLLALALLNEKPRHGYDLMRRFHDAGFERIKGPNLYPVLEKFEDGGLLASSWQESAEGPGRRVYSVTKAGHEELQALQDSWGRFSELVSATIEGKLP